MSKKTLYPVFIILCGVFLRFFYLTKKCFWCDEFLAISLSRIPSFSHMVRWIIKNDAHPPLFYSVIRGVFQFTQSELGLRLIPFLFGTGAVFIFYLLLKEREENHLLPLALFSFSPAAILWSQIVKSYSTLTFFSLLSLFMFLKYSKTGRPRDVTLWIISSLITLYLHNYGTIIILVELITLLLHRKKFLLKQFFLPMGIIFILYLPYLAGPLFSQIAFVRVSPHSVVNPVFRLGYTFFYFIFGETISPLNFKFVIPGIMLFLTFFIKGLFVKKDILNDFSIVVLITGIIVIFFIKSTIPQNLIHLQPFFFIIVASGIGSIEKHWHRQIISTIAILFSIPPLYYYYRQDSLQYHDVSKLIPYKEICRTIENEERQGEVVIITGGREKRFSEFFTPYSPWDWYYKGNLPVIEVGPEGANNLQKEMEEIYSRYKGFWLILNYGASGIQWNEDVKDFFIKAKSVKIREMKMIKNYSFLDVLKGKGRKEYYFIEVYHFVKEL